MEPTFQPTLDSLLRWPTANNYNNIINLKENKKAQNNLQDQFH